MRHTEIIDQALERRIRDTLAAVAATVEVDDPTTPTTAGRLPRRLVTAAATAAVLLGGLAVVATVRDDSTSTGPPSSLSADANRAGGLVVDPLTIDLDGWLADAPPWPPGAGGPYTIFDVDSIAADDLVVGEPVAGHPLHRRDGYVWQVEVTGPTENTFLVAIASRGAGVPSVDRYGAVPRRVEVAGTVGTADTAHVTWGIGDDLVATILWTSPADHSERALALANELTTVTVDALPEPAFTGPNDRAARDVELAGTIGGIPWGVDLRDDSTVSAYVVTDGHDTIGYSYGATGDETGLLVDATAVSGGVLVNGFGSTEIASVTVELSTGITISVPVHRSENLVGFGVPVPYGLDVVVITFADADGAVLERVEVPPFPEPSIGSVTLHAPDVD